MISSSYMIEEIYQEYIKLYLKNKDLLKDYSRKTIYNFMDNFTQLYKDKMIDKLSLNNFINNYFDEFLIEKNITNKFESNEIESNYNYNIETSIDNKDEKNKNNDKIKLDHAHFLSANEDLFYLKLNFLEQIIIKSIDSTSLLSSLFIKFLQKFDISIILLNFDTLHSFIKRIIMLSIDEENLEKYFIQINSINDKNNPNLIKFILLDIMIDNKNIDSIRLSKLIEENLTNFMDLLLYCNNLIKIVLPEVNESTSLKIIHKIHYRFSKMLKKMRLNSNFNKNLKDYYNLFINRITENKDNNLEDYTFLIIPILNETFNKENIKKTCDANILKLLQMIFTSNKPRLHKISVNILSNFHDLQSIISIDKLFLEKFISIFDVLDGYNSHLFKSLWKDLEYIILTCEKDESNLEEVNNLLFNNILNLRSSSPEQIFSQYFNYFYILANKVSNHENARIQKFFIKSFANLSKQLKNEKFELFLYNILIKMLNNPLFYPENESISYHAKVGIIAENLFTNWLINCSNNNERFEKNLDLLLRGIANDITFRRVFIYLFNSVKRSVIETNLKFRITNDVICSLNNILTKIIRYLSIFNKNKSWETICLVFCNSNYNYDSYINNNVELIKLFDSFIDFYVVKEIKSYINFEGISLIDTSYTTQNEKMITNFIKLFIDLGLYQNFIELYSKDLNIKFEDLLSLFQQSNLKLVDLNCFDIKNNIKLFWFVLVTYESSNNNTDNSARTEIFSSLFNERKRLFSYYIKDDYKQLILLNNEIFLKYLKILRGKIKLQEINQYLSDLYLDISEYFYDMFEKIINNLFNDNVVIPDDYKFIINNYRNYENILKEIIDYFSESQFNNKEILKNIFTISDKISSKLVIQTDYSLFLFKLSNDKIVLINFITNFLKHNLFEILVISNNNYKYDNKTFGFNVISFINFIENQFEKEKSIWLKENEIKLYYSNTLNNVIKIKTLILKTFDYNDNLVMDLSKEILLKTDDNYLDRVIQFLEKSNSEDLYYIFEFVGFYLKQSTNIEENSEYIMLINDDFVLKYINTGIKILIDNRDMLTYLNTRKFLESFIDKNIMNKYLRNNLSKVFNKIYDLNEKRTWLLLKLSTDLFLNILNEDISFISGNENVILDLAESKEIRGEDTYILKTSPNFLFSPFNIKVANFVKQDLLDEDISKYGLYIRVKLLGFFENYIKNINVNDKSNCLTILKLIECVLLIIDKNSASKAEMQFTAKHRKKLRLSQLLFTLSQIFKKISYEIIEDNNIILQTIENITIRIFEKINLQSVRYYFDLYCYNYCFFNKQFINYLFSSLTEPNTKTHCTTQSLIILSILIIENKKNDNISREMLNEIYMVISTLCTSNTCSIRGLAQYFIFKIHSIHSDITNTSNFSQNFYRYLADNTNIQRFFIKFNDSYERYNKLILDPSIECMLYENFDEINCEIIPLDFLKKFKELATQMVPIENEDLSKPNFSWKIEMNVLGNENEEKDIKLSTDFQKKYRPLEDNEDISSTIKKRRKRLDIIVIASLIDKAPNLGGLARTCEVFNIGAMTLSTHTVLNDVAFLSAAASAERWLPLLNVPVCDVDSFIKSYKKLGYTIIGLEQTSNSISLKECKFLDKCIILLGNEKEGIPQNLIELIDYCVIIPQFGEIRSLNVHVSAALMLWEIVNSYVGK